VDQILTLGFAGSHPSWRLSRQLRGVRKLAARYTGLHGVLSGKQSITRELADDDEEDTAQPNIIQRRLAAIERAKSRLPEERLGFFGAFGQSSFALRRRKADEELIAKRKMERVKEIDRVFAEGQ